MARKNGATVKLNSYRASVRSDQAVVITNGFLVQNAGNLLMAGEPSRMVSPLRAVWIVPVMLSYPGVGAVGQVGVVAVDEETANIVAWTPREEMNRKSEKLYAANRKEIEATFSKLTPRADTRSK